MMFLRHVYSLLMLLGITTMKILWQRFPWNTMYQHV